MAYHMISASFLPLYGFFLVPGQSPEVSPASVSSSPVSLNSQRQCSECLQRRFQKHWCSPEHFANNTGYCKDCARVCNICNILKKKIDYNQTHWENVRWYHRNSRCQACTERIQTKMFQCARCVVNGDKQWFDKGHFNAKDLANCKVRQTWEKLKCRMP